MDFDSFIGMIAVVSLAIIVAIIVCFVVNFVMTKVANLYMTSKADELLEAISKNAAKCKSIESSLLSEWDSYEDAIVALKLNRVINCSSSVVTGASRDGMKYLIKYSNIKFDNDSIEYIDAIRAFVENNNIFRKEVFKTSIKLKEKIPVIFWPFVNVQKATFWACGLDEKLYGVEDPRVIFSYISAAGRTSRNTTVILDESLIADILETLYSRVGKKRHSKTQRGKMTNDLREAIKKRDDYTCQICGNSVLKEPNLLLEVDHIIPVSKGGKTEADNLQTLCWRCNREKSDK